MFSKLFRSSSERKAAREGKSSEAAVKSEEVAAVNDDGGGGSVIVEEAEKEQERGESADAAGAVPEMPKLESSRVGGFGGQKQILLPEGKLTSAELHPRLVGHQGVPATASILAFEPVQRVLAVASLDGRIKLFGAPGLEALLQSPLRAPCKYLEFLNHGGQLINITTQNDIEVWALDKQEVVCSLKWEHDITAIAVLQGTTYMYLGDDIGTVSVLQYEESTQQLITLPYCIPAHITLGGIVKAGSRTAPSVVGILPHVDAAFSRLVIAYGNGLIALWGLHETGVLAIRGGTEAQRRRLTDFSTSLDRPRTFTERVADHAATLGEQFSSNLSLKSAPIEEEDEEEKEICSICWACQSGNTLAAGYVDGDIWLWKIPSVPKEKSQGEHHEPDVPTVSGTPISKVDLVPGKSMKMPVIMLKWCASGKGSKGPSGMLFVYGGSDLGATQALTVLSLDKDADDKLQQLELPLHGPFADTVILSSPGGSLTKPAAGILVLSSFGLLHMYDGAGIASHFTTSENPPSSAFLQPVPWQLPFRDAVVAKLILASTDGLAARVLLQLFPHSKDATPTLPAGTRWPITGGIPSGKGSSSDCNLPHRGLFLTGHKGGYVKVWDVSAPSVQLLCTINAQIKEEASSVTALELCDKSGVLAVGDQKGKVHLFQLAAEAQEVKCRIINGTSGGTGVVSNASPGFHCIASLSVHQAAISTITILSDSARLAVGDESGMISILDSATLSLLFHGSWPGNASSIVSLKFAVSQLPLEKDSVASPSLDPKLEQSPSSPPTETMVLYVTNKDATVAYLDGSTGTCLSPGPRQSKTPATMLCMDLLDESGIQATSVLPEEGAEDNQSSVQPSEADEKNSILILCTADCIDLVSISAQNFGDTLGEVKLDHSCCWASTFLVPSTHASGILLLYLSGHLELRSLPDLRILEETTLTQCLSWQLEPSLNVLRTLTCAANGHIALINEERELVQLSLLAEENDLRLPDSLPLLFDKDLAAAAEAAMKHTSLQRKKSSSTQSLLGVLKSALEQPAVHPASELPKLFSSRPFTVPAMQQSDLSVKTDSLGLDIDMEIDDIIIDLDDMDVNSSPSASGEASSNRVVLKRVTNSPKGKEVLSEEASRSQLFGDDGKPRQRTADEIKAAYGHPSKALDATSAAAMARDKLMERGEKLQSLNQRTEEMQAGAENFASLAEQLAKKYERRKWWEF